LSVYAWALLDTHFHLLVRSGNQSLSHSMRRLLTGYVVNFNRRHKRYGHLFQNRYKSILCEEDPYLLELTRYIHLNPLRAGIVKNLKELRFYAWSGHSTIMGKQKRGWQDVEMVLGYFGRRKRKAIAAYENYVGEGIEKGRRPDLVGGGLIRSLGGWSEVLSLRRRGEKTASDERILGSGEFIEQVLSETEEKARETLRWRGRGSDLQSLLSKISKKKGVEEQQVRGRDQRRSVVSARKVFSQMAVLKRWVIWINIYKLRLNQRPLFHLFQNVAKKWPRIRLTSSAKSKTVKVKGVPLFRKVPMMISYMSFVVNAPGCTI
jgi:putative transposase